ncbi:MAG: class I SAM-dependent methyltransferase [Blastocatellia bacterium]
MKTLSIISFCVISLLSYSAWQSPNQKESVYETRANHDPNGIGKFYLGREIAHVMGHQGADWLERGDREQTELPSEVVKQMNLKPTDVVADIGAGTGYFTFRIAPLVKQGKVLAVDIQPEMLAIIESRKKQFKADNVVTIQNTESDAKLPAASVDAVLFVDAYHEFSYPREMMESIFKGLKPGGRVIQIEYRGEDPDVPIKRVHKMTVAQARKEMAAVGLVWKETKSFLPQQHFIVFEKPAASGSKQ